MRNIVSMIVVALAAVGVVEAKPEVRSASHPVMHPIAFPTDVDKEKPKFHGKNHCKKHHARPYCKRCHKCSVRKFGRKPMRFQMHKHGK